MSLLHRWRVRAHRPTKAVVAPVPLIEDRGSFTHGFCPACGWNGPARRARATAARDFTGHQLLCPGSAAH
ncbi:hypothetical protein ACQP1U_15770 [Actinomycetota bacterium]